MLPDYPMSWSSLYKQCMLEYLALMPGWNVETISKEDGAPAPDKRFVLKTIDKTDVLGMFSGMFLSYCRDKELEWELQEIRVSFEGKKTRYL